MKTTFITDINKIKFEVNTEVARMAFAGELDEKANEIPYKRITDDRLKPVVERIKAYGTAGYQEMLMEETK